MESRKRGKGIWTLWPTVLSPKGALLSVDKTSAQDSRKIGLVQCSNIQERKGRRPAEDKHLAKTPAGHNAPNTYLRGGYNDIEEGEEKFIGKRGVLAYLLQRTSRLYDQKGTVPDAESTEGGGGKKSTSNWLPVSATF